MIVWDLAHDPRELFGLNADELRLRLFSKTADLPEGVTRLPVKSVHINKSPMVVGNLKILSPALCAEVGHRPGHGPCNMPRSPPPTGRQHGTASGPRSLSGDP
jgi:hypothetical protein